MIKNFKSKALKMYWEMEDASGLPAQRLKKIRKILQTLDFAQVMPEDMHSDASWKVHRLKGTREKYWSAWVSGNYRIVFLFMDGDAYDVDYLDYH